MRRSTWWQALLLVVVVAGLVGWRISSGGDDVDQPDGTNASIAVSELPAEARQTLELVDAGGPYPYDRDGLVFMNRERLLPLKPRGYWREFTVRTPGESGRGPRRLVSGQGGEVYYSDDHYASFTRVRRGAP
ncbi:MAG: guanine-specific ribonuclease [Aeromicrobium sp.]|nr:guanine-specific ribonuclease [Aeromicrobium sp.]